MAISTDILASYLHPRAVIRRKLDQGVRGVIDQGLGAVLIAGLVLAGFLWLWLGALIEVEIRP